MNGFSAIFKKRKLLCMLLGCVMLPGSLIHFFLAARVGQPLLFITATVQIFICICLISVALFGAWRLKLSPQQFSVSAVVAFVLFCVNGLVAVGLFWPHLDALKLT